MMWKGSVGLRVGMVSLAESLEIGLGMDRAGQTMSGHWMWILG